MAAKRRYRIVGQLGSNRRLAGVGVEAALLYLLALPYGDREGRLFGEPGDLIDEVCPAFARRHGWSEGFVDGLIEELVRVGLWERWSGPEGRVVGICRWHDHQHPSRLAEERPSAFADPPPSPYPSPPLKSNGSEWNNRTEPDEIVRNRPEPSGSPAAFHVDDEISRIRRCYCRSIEEVTNAPATLNPGDVEIIKAAAGLGTCRKWETEEALGQEMVRTLRGMSKRSLPMKSKVLFNHLDESWEDKQNGHTSARKPYVRKEGDPFGPDPATGRPYHPGA